MGVFFGFVQGFGLYASVFIIPVFCQSMLGYTSQQTGWLLMPGSIATGLMMPVVGMILKKKKVNPLILAALGFSAFVFFIWSLSGMNMQTNPDDFFWPLIIRGIGMGLLFIPLTTITLMDLENKDIPQGSALSNMMRQLGGSFGIAVMTTIISIRSVFHFSRLSENVSVYNTPTVERMNASLGLFMSKGDAPAVAQSKALLSMNGTVMKQAMILTYNDLFLIIGLFFAACIPLLLLFVLRKNAAPNVSEQNHAVDELIEM